MLGKMFAYLTPEKLPGEIVNQLAWFLLFLYAGFILFLS